MIVALSIDLHGILGNEQACMQFTGSDDTDWPIRARQGVTWYEDTGVHSSAHRVRGPTHRVHVRVT